MTDTMTTAPVPAHVLGVVSDGYEYLVECSCGWASGWHGTPDEADFEGGEHRDSAVGAADHMDVLMSGLLDLQDDIAAVVVWLAEYWSVDLPRLGWSACGDDRDDRRALRVLGYADPGELAAAAAVLGATPADDPVNDGGRTRYRHVKRDFGRVQIDVFTSLTRAQAAETAL